MIRTDAQQQFLDRYGVLAIDTDAVWRDREILQDERNTRSYHNAEPTAPAPRPAHSIEPTDIKEIKYVKPN